MKGNFLNQICAGILLALLLVCKDYATSQQGDQGQDQRTMDRSISAISNKIRTYLNGDQITSVLTPGEFSSWNVSLKAGQVLIGEASSDAFDPAMEIANSAGKVVAYNDDRYPGDQRPLLFWRCDQDGNYQLRVRCYHNKSGGQFKVRWKVYDSVDLNPNKVTEFTFNTQNPLLMRFAMTKGEVATISTPLMVKPIVMTPRIEQIISPIGLPNTQFSDRLQSVSLDTLVEAPVSGDYYAYLPALMHPGSKGEIQVMFRELPVHELSGVGSALTGTAPNGQPALWEANLNAGDFIQISTPQLSLKSNLAVAIEPNISKTSLDKPSENPFYPRENQKVRAAPFQDLPARARDSRKKVIFVRKTGMYWIASSGTSYSGGSFKLVVQSAAKSFGSNGKVEGNLKIANTDYWKFQAQPGEILNFNAHYHGFDPVEMVYSPHFNILRNKTLTLDKNSDAWQIVTSSKGRYVVAISCLGDGGSGSYSLARNVIMPKLFTIQHPATGEISGKDIQAWKFVATPDQPLIFHVSADNWGFFQYTYDGNGQPTYIQETLIGRNDQVGIINVGSPTTYILVFVGQGHGASSYSVSINPVPGLKKHN